MRLIGNIIWLVLGGLILAVIYVIAGILNCILIITIPFGVASFRMAGYALWPFGRVVVDRGKGSGSGIRLIGNIIWLIFGGLILAVMHLVAAVFCAITIIGIPFAVAHLRLAGLALMPLGKQIVPIAEARRTGEATAVGVDPARTDESGA
jgi:uncharacterized membrane protein YccF (DUF307 family)